MEREQVQARGPEAAAANAYESSMQRYAADAERRLKGKIVIRAEDRPWQDTRQGRLKYYLNYDHFQDSTLDEWKCFVQDIRRHSGKHRHQGGLVIYVWEGRGWTEIDGERVEWEAGDLMILPIKPGGVEHQHFNADPDVGCKWIAFIHMPWHYAVGNLIRQVKTVSDE